MPLFFLLSGFCLTLGYGKTQYDGIRFFDKTSKTPSDNVETNSKPKIEFDFKKFLIGRFTRILPIYWLTFLINLPLIFLGHSYYAPDSEIGYLLYNFTIFISLFQSWIGQMAGGGPNWPAWTISTLFFFYYIYPW